MMEKPYRQSMMGWHYFIYVGNWESCGRFFRLSFLLYLQGFHRAVPAENGGNLWLKN